MHINDFKIILNKKNNSDKFVGFVNKINEKYEIYEYDNREYYTFKEQGFDLVFDDEILMEIQIFSSEIESDT